MVFSTCFDWNSPTFGQNDSFDHFLNSADAAVINLIQINKTKSEKYFFFGISWSKWPFLVKIRPPTDKLIQQPDISVVTSCKHKCCAVVLCLARRVEKTVKLYGWYWYHLVLLWYPAQLWLSWTVLNLRKNCAKGFESSKTSEKRPKNTISDFWNLFFTCFWHLFNVFFEKHDKIWHVNY